MKNSDSNSHRSVSKALFQIMLYSAISFAFMFSNQITFADEEPNDISTPEQIFANEPESGSLHYGGSNDIDYTDVYRFEMPLDGSLEMNFTASGVWYDQGNAIINVGVNNTVCCGNIYYAPIYPDQSTVKFGRIAAGTVLFITFIGSNQYLGSGLYSFIINADYLGEPNDFEPNDSYATSQQFLPNSSITGHQGFTSVSNGALLFDNSDFYSLTLPSSGSLILNTIVSTTDFESNSINFDFQIYDSGYHLKLNHNSSGNYLENLYYDAGTYYIRIHSINNGLGYTITNTFTPDCTPPMVSISVDNDLVCKPSKSNLTANTTGTSSTYQWKKGNADIEGATNSTYAAKKTAIYKCVVINACGTDTSNSISITVNAQPTANITPSGSVNMCSGQTTLLGANQGENLSYQWIRNSTEISEATDQTYNATKKGTYKVIVTNDLTGCSKTSPSTKIKITCKTEPGKEDPSSILIYPNPTSGTFTLTLAPLENITQNIFITDLTGKILIRDQKEVRSQNLLVTYDLSKFTTGVYLIKVVSGIEMTVQKIEIAR